MILLYIQMKVAISQHLTGTPFSDWKGILSSPILQFIYTALTFDIFSGIWENTGISSIPIATSSISSIYHLHNWISYTTTPTKIYWREGQHVCHVRDFPPQVSSPVMLPCFQALAHPKPPTCPERRCVGSHFCSTTAYSICVLRQLWGQGPAAQMSCV